MGGGRLRPAPRTHRHVARFEPGRPTTYGTQRPHEVGVESPPDDEVRPFEEAFDAEAYEDDGPTTPPIPMSAAQGPADSVSAAPATVVPDEDDAPDIATDDLVSDAGQGQVAAADGSAPDAAPGPTPQGAAPWKHGHVPERGPRRFDQRPGGHPGPGRPPMAAQMPPGGPRPAPHMDRVGPDGEHLGPAGDRVGPSCTAPQLRRFIKSRAYVPMHELRRRFGILGGDDDVAGIDLEAHRVFVGLPAAEAQLLGDLLRGGEIGAEYSMDPQTPVVVGVYAMRPVPRP
jgi:hypothetical protein